MQAGVDISQLCSVARMKNSRGESQRNIRHDLVVHALDPHKLWEARANCSCEVEAHSGQKCSQMRRHHCDAKERGLRIYRRYGESGAAS